jgi:hypothetical protein
MSSEILIKKINNIKVKKVPTTSPEDQRPIKGSKLFPRLSCNIFLCAKKFSGKTSCIYETIKHCVGRNTKIIVFCGSLYNDKSWKTIQNYCKSKKIDFEGHVSIFDDDGDNILQAFIDHLKTMKEGKDDEIEEDEEEVEEEQPVGIWSQGWGEETIEEKPEKKKKPRKSKYQSPEYMVILDDISTELKNSSVTALLKIHRHWSMKCIISSQQVNDLSVGARNQIDVTIIYKGMPIKKIDEIYKICMLNITLDQLMKMYNIATAKPFSFLYIDASTQQYRMNFDSELLPS